MNRRTARPRTRQHPVWILLWVPPLLIALDDSPDLSSAMLRLAAVLLIGTLAWGMGRGPAEPGAERAFAALLLVAWFAACGTAFREQGVPPSIPARLAMAAALLLGPGFLYWAWQRRSRMMRVVDAAGALTRSPTGSLIKVALIIAVALVGVDRAFGLQTGDLLVIGTGIALFATLRVRGRRWALGALG